MSGYPLIFTSEQGGLLIKLGEGTPNIRKKDPLKLGRGNFKIEKRHFKFEKVSLGNVQLYTHKIGERYP